MASKKQHRPALATRLSPEEKRAFDEKALQFGGTSYVLRELAIGFIEDRIKMAPPKPSELFKGR